MNWTGGGKSRCVAQRGCRQLRERVLDKRPACSQTSDGGAELSEQLSDQLAPVGILRHRQRVGGVASPLGEDRRLGDDVEGEDGDRPLGVEPAQAVSPSPRSRASRSLRSRS